MAFDTLSVVTIHHDDAVRTSASVATTCAVLDQLSEATEVIVVDNGPTHEVDDLEGVERVRVVHSPKRQGFGANANLGLASARSPLVLLLNDDAEVSPDCIRSLLDAVAQSGAAACVPRVVDLVGDPLASAWRFPTLAGIMAFAIGSTRWPYVQSRGDRPRWVEAASAGVMLVRRDPVLAIGGFDEEFFMYGEDTDLARRLESARLGRLYVPRAQASHASQSSTAHFAREREREQWRGRHRFWQKHCGRTETAAIRATLALVYFLAGAGARLRGKTESASRYWRFIRYSLAAPQGGGLRELADAWNAERAGSTRPEPLRAG